MKKKITINRVRIKEFNVEKVRKKIEELRKKTPHLPINSAATIDLVPESHRYMIQREKTRKQWLYTNFLVGGVCLIVIMFMAIMNVTVNMQLTKEKNEQQSILKQIGKYAAIDESLSQQKAAQQMFDEAAGGAVSWTTMIQKIHETLPPGTQIESMSISTGGQEEVSSSIILHLSSEQVIDYSNILQKVNSVNGIKSSEIGGLSMDSNGRYLYDLTFTVDTSVLTNEYGLGE